MKITDFKNIYFIGIKGAGMCSAAEILLAQGFNVSGSDTKEVFYTDEILKRLGIAFAEEFAVENIPQATDLVVFSTAYKAENNVEIAEVQKRGLPMVSYPELLGMLIENKLGIAVCGTHGKTTTSAMLSEALREAGTDPSAIIGSRVISWQGGALSGKGDYFVLEADEYQNKLQYYHPWSAILTSVDWDHPDFFPDFSIYKQTFKDFVKKIPRVGFLVVWGDSTDTLEVASAAASQVLTYGFGSDNKYQIVNHTAQRAKQTFEIVFGEKKLGFFETQLSGKHNVLNAAAVIALTHAAGLDVEKIKSAIANFRGTTRRFETVGKFRGALLIDDYAHHPDEIKATLQGAKERFKEQRIWAVFHPHTFTRTSALLEEFAQSFDDCDKVMVLDVYGSAREVQGGVSSTDLVKLINKYNPGKAEHVSTIDQAVEQLVQENGAYDVLITMGAGDVWRVGEKLKSQIM